MLRRNLILIHRGPEYTGDFDEIAVKVNARDPLITVYHMPPNYAGDLPAGAWDQPTLTVALLPRFRFKVRRGPVLMNKPMSKLDQQEVFRQNRIPFPPALPFRFGMKLDPILFGDFVLLKPADLRLTSRDNGTIVLRRRRAEAVTPDDFPPTHPLRASAQGCIVQRFIHTGEYPSCYRATTFMGEVLSLELFEAKRASPPLSAPDSEIERGAFAPKTNRHFSFVEDEDVLQLARHVAACFPGLPLLGIDILRDTAGRLYALETNGGGNTWHFSSKNWAEHRRTNPEYYQYMRTQFGAFDIAAERLCEAVHRLAS